MTWLIKYSPRVIIVTLLFFAGCKKDTGKKPVSFPSYQSQPDNFTCGKRDIDTTVLPPEPPAGFLFANKFGNKGVWRILYDLIDRDVIYYTTLQENNTNYLNKLNRRTNEKVILDMQVLNTISINKSGWLVYEKVDKNIYKIKTNGDSLMKLTSRGSCLLPTWSYDGNFIYYYDDGFTSSGGGKVYKLDKNGKYLDTLSNISPASFVYASKSNLYYLKVDGGSRFICQRNLNNGAERNIVSKNNSMGAEINSFWFTDENEQNLYWYQNQGLFVTNLYSLMTKKIFSSNYGTNYNTMFYCLSPITKRFLAMQYHREFISPATLLGSCEIIEFSDSTCIAKVKLPD